MYDWTGLANSFVYLILAWLYLKCSLYIICILQQLKTCKYQTLIVSRSFFFSILSSYVKGLRYDIIYCVVKMFILILNNLLNLDLIISEKNVNFYVNFDSHKL